MSETSLTPEFFHERARLCEQLALATNIPAIRIRMRELALAYVTRAQGLNGHDEHVPSDEAPIAPP